MKSRCLKFCERICRYLFEDMANKDQILVAKLLHRKNRSLSRKHLLPFQVQFPHKLMLMAKDISKVLQEKVSECGYLIRFPWPYDWCYKSPKYTPPGAPKKFRGNLIHLIIGSIIWYYPSTIVVFTLRHLIYYI